MPTQEGGSHNNIGWLTLGYVSATDIFVLLTAFTVFLIKRWSVSRKSNTDASIRTCRFTSFGSIAQFVTMPLDEVRRVVRSESAFEYLWLQQKLVVILIIFSLLSIFVLVPEDLAESATTSTGLGATTVEAVKPGSGTLWYHIGLTWLFGVLIVSVFFSYVNKFKRVSKDDLEARTVFVKRGLADKWASDEILKERIQKNIESSNLKRCRIAHAFIVKDLNRLRELESRKQECLNEIERETILSDAASSKKRSRLSDEVSNTRLQQRNLLLAESDAQEGLLGGFPTTGKAFLTFETAEGALRFLSAASNASDSGLSSSSLGIENWTLSPAPPQSDVQWDVMYMPQFCRFMLLITINIAIVIMLLLFTTPTAVLSTAQSLHDSGWIVFRPLEKLLGFAGSIASPHSADDANHHYNHSEEDSVTFVHAVVFSYLPSLMLLLINTVLLYTIYAAANYLEPYLTHSETQRAIMQKSFLFLLFNSVLLPALSLGSINALLGRFEQQIRCGQPLTSNEAIQGHGSKLLSDAESNIKCGSSLLGTVFLQGSGSYFVVYVIHLACLTNTSQLLRIPERLYFSYARRVAVTAQEKEEAQKNWPFEIGQQYALILEAFAVCVVFSTSVPLILPVGVVCLAFRHLVDKYNILYVWRGQIRGARSVSVRAHELLLMIAALHQLLMLGLMGLRGTKMQFRVSGLMFLIMLVTVIVLIRDRETKKLERRKRRWNNDDESEVGESVRLLSTDNKKKNKRKEYYCDPLLHIVKSDVL